MKGFLAGSDSKESACNVGDLRSVPGLGRGPGEGNSYPLRYSGLAKSTDRGGWQATVPGPAKSRTRLSDLTLTCQCVCQCLFPYLSPPL